MHPHHHQHQHPSQPSSQSSQSFLDTHQQQQQCVASQLPHTQHGVTTFPTFPTSASGYVPDAVVTNTVTDTFIQPPPTQQPPAVNQRPNWYVSNNPSAPETYATFANHMVIPPPINREELEKLRTSFVVVDSASRNHSEYPEPNDYTMPLPSEIRDVQSLQLVSYKMPTPQFPIRSTNNRLHFTTTDVTVTQEVDGTYTVDNHKRTNMTHVSVDVGTYAEAIAAHTTTDPSVQSYHNELVASLNVISLQQDAVCRALEAALNAAAGSTFVVHVDEVSETYTITTNFANSADPTSFTNPTFFQPFFQGCEEYYCDKSVDTTCNKTRHFGKTHHKYPEHSIGAVLGQPRIDPPNQLCGTVTFDGGDTLSGAAGASFTTELQVGDWLYLVELDDTTKRSRVRVEAVVSDTEVTVDTSGGVPPAHAASYAWRGRTTSPWARNLTPDCYISMFIDNADTLQSFTTSIDEAFYLLPSDTSVFHSIPEYLPFKRFSPPLGRLDKLSFAFRNPDNTLYDFKGKNHVLVFKVVHYRQNVNYGDF